MTAEDVDVNRFGVIQNVNYSLSGRGDFSLEALSFRRRISDLEHMEQHLRRQVTNCHHTMSFAKFICMQSWRRGLSG